MPLPSTDDEDKSDFVSLAIQSDDAHLGRTDLDANLGLPLHRQVTEVLLSQIANGQFLVGDRLPTEEALCRQFGISRVTVRLALKELENDGLLERSPGRGTFLKHAPAYTKGDSVRELVDVEDLIAAARDKPWSLQRTGVMRAPSRAAQALGLQQDGEAPYHVSVHHDGAILWAMKRFYHPSIARHVDEEVLEAADFDLALTAKLGGPVTVESGWVEALIAEPHMVITLRLPVGTPLLSLWTISKHHGEPVVVAQLLLPGNGIGASFSLPGL